MLRPRPPRLTWILAALAFTPACGPRPEPTPAPATASPPGPPDIAAPELEAPKLEGSHVVVRSGARFFPSAEASEPISTRSYLVDMDTAGTLAATHIGWVMRLGQVTPTRVEVITVPGETPGLSCGLGLEGLSDFELHMWVERHELVAVTPALTTLRFEDGSAIHVPSGVPLRPAVGDFTARLMAWDFELELRELVSDLPAPAFAFDPAELPPFEPKGTAPEAGLSLAGQPFNPGYLGGDVFVDESTDPPTYRLRGRCVEVEPVRVAGLGAVGFGWAGPLGGGGYGGTQVEHFFAVEAGTPVRWPDGNEAGRMREAARLRVTSAPGEGRCGYFKAGDGSRDVALCFDSADTRALPLGHVVVEELRAKPEPEAEARARQKRQIEVLAQALREPCISYAVEAEPRLDLELKVRAKFGPGEDRKQVPEVKVRATGVGASDELNACIEERVASWRLDDVRVDLDLRLSARPQN